jgi:polar amino acid transport system substrate-binding protein
MFDSGLQIMVRADNNGGFSIWQIWSILSTGAMPFLLSLMAALIIIPSHLVWYAERRSTSHFISQKYFPGIWQAAWWAIGAVAGQQPDSPASKWGRILAAMAILVSMVFMSYFQATITSALTIQTLKGDINGPEDLVGRKVGTTTGSTAAGYIKSLDVVPTEFSKITEAFTALENKQLDAVVFDSPVLLYYAATKGRNKVRLVGPMLRKITEFCFRADQPCASRLTKRFSRFAKMELMMRCMQNGSLQPKYKIRLHPKATVVNFRLSDRRASWLSKC